MVLPMFLRLVLSILYFLCETSTRLLDSCPLGDTWCGVVLLVLELNEQSERVIFSRASLFVAPYWWATRMAKQLSTATTRPLCFVFFQCRVDVSQSWFSCSTISFAEFNVSTKRRNFLKGMIKLRDFLSLIMVNPKATTPRAFKNLS